jgi:hypothetical protein
MYVMYTKPLLFVYVLNTKAAVFCAYFVHKELPSRRLKNRIFCIAALIFPLLL